MEYTAEEMLRRQNLISICNLIHEAKINDTKFILDVDASKPINLTITKDPLTTQESLTINFHKEGGKGATSIKIPVGIILGISLDKSYIDGIKEYITEKLKNITRLETINIQISNNLGTPGGQPLTR